MGTNLIYNLPKAEILAQLAEEASELAQAALKSRRAIDKENPHAQKSGRSNGRSD